MAAIIRGKATTSETERRPGPGSVADATPPKLALSKIDRVARVGKAKMEGPGQRRKMRILMANEPRSYREVMATILQELVPNVEASLAEPEALDREVARLAPDLVICSQATQTVHNAGLSWIALYPEGSNHPVISVRGRRWRVLKPTLDDVFAVIDEVRRPLSRDPSG